VAEEITRKGDEAFFVAVDVRNEAAAVAGATDSGYQTVGRIDVLVKVAWIIRKGPGASLSAGEPLDYLTEEPFEEVIFDAYLMDEGNFELRDTDGSTLVSASFDGSRLGVTVGGAKRTIGLRLMPLPGAPNMEAVSANGVELGYVEGLEIVPDAEAGWARDPDGTVRTVIHRDW
jgi:hypothetical protein